MTDQELRHRTGAEYHRMSPRDRAFVRLNYFDYKRQARVVNGVYEDCGHPPRGTLMGPGSPNPGGRFSGCTCYGRAHAGEPATGAGLNS